jgi:transcription elongation GreA/GreB family factor
MSNKAPSQQQPQGPTLDYALERLAEGKPTHCLHQNWGLGILRTHDAEKGVLTIDFPEVNKRGHVMDVAFCRGKLEILDSACLLAQAYSPDTQSKIATLVADDPVGLVKTLLAETPHGELSAIRLELALERVVAASLTPGKDRAVSFKNWWTRAKASLRKDRGLLLPERKGGTYTLLETPSDPAQDLLAQLTASRDDARRLQLLAELATLSAPDARTIANAENLEGISNLISEGLTQVPPSGRPARRGERLADLLVAVWNRNLIFAPVNENVATVAPTASDVAALVTDEAELLHLALNIPHSSDNIRALLDLVRAHHGANWQEKVYGLLSHKGLGQTKGGSAKLVTETINYLSEAGLEKELASRLADWVERRQAAGPVLIWIIKNRGSKKHADVLSGLSGSGLLRAILASIGDDALASNSTARNPLANELQRDRSLLSDLLRPDNGAPADTETIFDLARSLVRTMGLDPMTKKSLLARLIAIEPAVDSVAKSLGEAQSEPGTAQGTERVEKVLYVSAASKALRLKELEEIVKTKLPEINESIQVAKEHGDLRENSEYKMARQEKDRLQSRASELERGLRKAEVTDFTQVGTDVIGIGSLFDLTRASTGETSTRAILGAWDSDTEGKVIIMPYLSPLAKGLLGRKAGETVKVSVGQSAESWTVSNLRRWVDSAR